MDVYMIVLRIFHVISGVLWVGGGILYLGFVEPAIRVTMPASQKFVKLLMPRYTQYMAAVGGLTVLAGALLYLRDSNGLSLAWITTATGVGLTLGALLALVGFVLGFVAVKPRADRMGKLSAEIEAGSKPPTKEQAAEMGTLNASLVRLGRITFGLLTLALVCMATARYW